MRSTRSGTGGAGATDASDVPYSSSYHRMTSPTGRPGHSVASPLSRAMTSRCRPPSDRGPPPVLNAWEVPPSRSSAHTTNPRSNSRTRTSRCWYAGMSPLIHSSARSCACAKVTIDKLTPPPRTP
nr:hypothetical protein [Streptomyces himalayensis]